MKFFEKRHLLAGHLVFDKLLRVLRQTHGAQPMLHVAKRIRLLVFLLLRRRDKE